MPLGFIIATAVAKAGYSVPTTGLIGYWSGDGTAADASPTGNHGSFGGSYAPNGPTNGKAFDLATGKVKIPHNTAYGFTGYAGWSVGFWFNGNGTPISAGNGLFLGQDNGSGYQPKWFIDYDYTVLGSNGRYNLHVNDFNKERIFVGSDTQPPATGWNQLTVTIDNVADGRVEFYLNGQAIGTNTLGAYVLQTNAELIFGTAEGFTFGGLLSDVVIHNRAFSASEALQLASFSTEDPPFVITDVSADGKGNSMITWQSSPGRTYQLRASPGQDAPMHWADVGNPVVATGSSTSATVPITAAANFFVVTSR